MKRLVGYACAAVLLAGFLVGCQGNLMSQSEKLLALLLSGYEFINLSIDHTI